MRPRGPLAQDIARFRDKFATCNSLQPPAAGPVLRASLLAYDRIARAYAADDSLRLSGRSHRDKMEFNARPSNGLAR